jgi:hypothetical protein
LQVGNIEVMFAGSYKTMAECFEARDKIILNKYGGERDQFDENEQAVCIKSNVGF